MASKPTIYRGRTKTWGWTIYADDTNQTPANLTGFTAPTLRIGTVANDTTLVTIAATVTDAANGLIQAVIDDTDSESLTVGTYNAQLTITDGASEPAMLYDAFVDVKEAL